MSPLLRAVVAFANEVAFALSQVVAATERLARDLEAIRICAEIERAEIASLASPPATDGDAAAETSTITVHCVEMSDEAAEAVFDRVAEAAHALDEDVFCVGTLRPSPVRDTETSRR